MRPCAHARACNPVPLHYFRHFCVFLIWLVSHSEHVFTLMFLPTSHKKISHWKTILQFTLVSSFLHLPQYFFRDFSKLLIGWKKQGNEKYYDVKSNNEILPSFLQTTEGVLLDTDLQVTHLLMVNYGKILGRYSFRVCYLFLHPALSSHTNNYIATNILSN